MKRIVGLTVALFAAVISMTACTPNSAVDELDSSAVEPIRFGVIAPLTGPVADAGSYVVSGLRIGVEKINE